MWKKSSTESTESINFIFFRYVALGAISNQVADAFTRPIGGADSDASRGDFLDVLREVAREQSGLNLRGPIGPIAVGRCAQREASNQCCAGSSWDCQAPGSTCSCDQVNFEFFKVFLFFSNV